MPRLSFKPDASFVRYIALGAIGTRAVRADLSDLGHELIPLENGSTDTKLWKEVKRKRVRIPDLVCTRCGVRVESRAKSNADISMSHSDSDAERAWDYGMVGGDLVAFPIVEEVESDHWSTNGLVDDHSYYSARERSRWRVQGVVNYFQVSSLRDTPHSGSSQKGVTEGSETTISWDAIFSTREGEVERVEPPKFTIRRASDGHAYTWQNRKELPLRIDQGEYVYEGDVLASSVAPISRTDLQCLGGIDADKIARLLASPERTQRFAGLRIARARHIAAFADEAEGMLHHPEEDLYVRIEAGVYLVACSGEDPEPVFGPFLSDADDQVRLEAVLALAEAGTEEAVEVLGEIILSSESASFLRAAAAWSLGRIGSTRSTAILIEAFDDVDPAIRTDVLDSLTDAGSTPDSGLLLEAVTTPASDHQAAGSAETLRRLGQLDEAAFRKLIETASDDAIWPAWLIGAFEAQGHAGATAAIDETPEGARFAILVVSSFMRSWIAETWELNPSPQLLHEAND